MQKGAQPKLIMRFASGSVKHFGLQMYATPAPSIAEMIANAWDADAKVVNIKIPLGQPITPGLSITITDDGHGMSADDCDQKFLVVGREKRKEEDRTPNNRPVIGRKGLGKFAPFGIAWVIDVRSVKEGQLTHFRMDYRDMEIQEPWQQYEPQVLDWGPTNEPSGTTIILSELRLQRALNEGIFRRALERRFSCFGQDFTALVNDVPLQRYRIGFDFRIPETGEESTQLSDGNSITWWVAFAPKPLPLEEFAGVAVTARGKMIQEPFFFDLAGGTHAQHGLPYMAGIVTADYLDDDRITDLVATDRSTIRWEDPLAQLLLEWGQTKIKEWLRAWNEHRAEVRLARLETERPQLVQLLQDISKLPGPEKEELSAIVNRLASTVADDDSLVWAVNAVHAAYGDRHFIGLVRAIADIAEPSLEDVINIFREYELLESARLAQITAARIELIIAFERMIAEEAPEKAADVPSMQDLLADHPWLLNQQWQILRHERALDTIIAEEMNLTPRRDKAGRSRLDFFCLADSRRAVVVEIKRPGHTVEWDEWKRFTRYVSTLRLHYQRITNHDDKREVEGLLIASRLEDTVQQEADDAAKAGIMKCTDWKSLLNRVQRESRDYFDALISKTAPSDPRRRILQQLIRSDPEDPAAIP